MLLSDAEIRSFDPVGRAFVGSCRKPVATRNFRNFTCNLTRDVFGNIGPALAFAAPPRYLAP